MKKSVFTFGLLTISLVMLAVMPILNNNHSFANTAIAQKYDKYGNSSYTQYHTDDKKYECRTGPFEGFFVSSVEFCKHVKFDDRKDHSRDGNRTGAQGPPGPQGPQGIQGIQDPIGPNGTQGPAGINVINSSNLYDRKGILDTVLFNLTEATSIAECDDENIAINGSFLLVLSPL